MKTHLATCSLLALAMLSACCLGPGRTDGPQPEDPIELSSSAGRTIAIVNETAGNLVLLPVEGRREVALVPGASRAIPVRVRKMFRLQSLERRPSDGMWVILHTSIDAQIDEVASEGARYLQREGRNLLQFQVRRSEGETWTFRYTFEVWHFDARDTFELRITGPPGFEQPLLRLPP